MKAKNIIMFIAVIIVGGVLGVISKYGDVAIMGTLSRNIMSALGNLTSALFIWIAACMIIAVYSEKRMNAAINVLAFLLSMLVTYYLYSKLVVGYLAIKVVAFWGVMLIPSAILAYFIWGMRENKKLRKIVLIISAIEMVFDIFILQGADLIALLITALIFIVMLICVLFKTKKTHSTKCA